MPLGLPLLQMLELTGSGCDRRQSVCQSGIGSGCGTCGVRGSLKAGQHLATILVVMVDTCCCVETTCSGSGGPRAAETEDHAR